METHYKYALIGSMAAAFAAQNIRELDKEGNILLVGDEPHPPYDRPPLSKQMLAKNDYQPEDAYSKYDDFYPKNQVELRRAVRASSLNREARTLTMDDGHTITYEKLLLATGASPRMLDVPGKSRTGVFLLRKIEDSVAIRVALQASKRIVVVGAGYLGMEVAADAAVRGLEVTIVESSDRPWPKFSSKELGSFVQRAFEEKGCRFNLGDEAVEFVGDGEKGPVRGVRLASGETAAADAVVVAVGVELNTELARAAGLEVDPKDGIIVDEFLRTSDPSIWAAGDVACFHDIALGKRWHIEHHLNAKWQGQVVGKIMAGDTTPYDRVPYFFSDFLDLHMILRGDSLGGKRSIVAGDIAAGEFTELYLNDEGVLVMGVSISHEEPKLDPVSDRLEELIRKRIALAGREAEVQAAGFDLTGLS